MRVLHVPYTYFPEPCGGTEVYVASLCRESKALGVEPMVAAPGKCVSNYFHQNIAVRTFPLTPDLPLSDLYSEGDASASESFGKLLDSDKPDIVQFHALTSGASVLAMREVKKRKIPLVFTYHTPTVTCVRGTMLKWGEVPCNGDMDANPCAACALQSKGLPKPIGKCLGAAPEMLLGWLGNSFPSSKVATSLRMPGLIRQRHAATREAFRMADRVVAVCEWVRDVIISNGVATDRILLCRQGLATVEASASVSGRAELLEVPHYFNSQRPLRLVFFGRIDPTKGIHTVIRALEAIPDAPIRLDIYGVVQPEAHSQYFENVQALAARDARIRVLPPIPSEQVVSVLKQYDLLVVPSLWLETGPLVVYEAFAAKVPVLGTRRGGIAELVQDGLHGHLINPGCIHHWTTILDQVIHNPELIKAWKANLPEPRSMADAARSLLELYHQLSP